MRDKERKGGMMECVVIATFNGKEVEEDPIKMDEKEHSERPVENRDACGRGEGHKSLGK